MEISVVHDLNYRYSKPVYIEPQTIYLTPRWNFNLDVKDFRLEIIPAPVLLSSNIDIEGNPQIIAHFNGLAESLKVRSSFNARSGDFNPFEFVVHPFESQTLPLHYPENISEFMSPYLTVKGDKSALRDYGNQVLSQKNISFIDFINALAQKISTGFSYEYRETGNAMTPEELIKTGKGACRDFSNLYIAVCRSFGIASRFVSGYFQGDNDQSSHLHGWVEIFIPGAGWRGVDPTQGAMTDHKYIALAASAETDKVAPVSGSFRGDAGAEMTVLLVMK